MLLGSIFERFVNNSPVSVMVRGLLEHALAAEELDRLFDETARRQYTRALLFSSVVEVLSLVVCKFRPSVHAAYQADPGRVGVSLRALYDKLDHTEPALTAALVRHSGQKLLPLLRRLRGGLPPLLPGYRVKVLDGNHLAATQRRLQELRDLRGGPLPGQALVVLDPQWMLVTDVLCGEDGHAQERAYLPGILPLVRRGEVWVADRNFCTTDFLFGLARRGAFFVIRQHAQALHWEPRGQRRYCGRGETGEVFEQEVELRDGRGNTMAARRVTVELDRPTRDGDREIHVLTNLPVEDADARAVARLYGQRWTIEAAFADLEKNLASEIDTLAYPKAALFAFGVALVAYNLLSAVKAALRAAHGAKAAEGLSSYYLADEVAGTYRGMMIAIPDEHWRVFAQATTAELAGLLKDLARRVDLAALRKHPRGAKKPRPPKPVDQRRKHVSTARLLAGRSTGTK
jgi:IS4 transposase